MLVGHTYRRILTFCGTNNIDDESNKSVPLSYPPPTPKKQLHVDVALQPDFFWSIKTAK